MRTVPAALYAAIVLALSVNAATTRFGGYTFEAYAVTASAKRMSESRESGRPTLYVNEGEEYSIVLRNPLPVRVGVALTVDGLNSIDGERNTPSKASKWILEPHSSITIRGWQTGLSKSRRFVFTNKSESYAEWKEDRDRTDYTRNLGVIGVAWFWSGEELRRTLNPPRPFVSEDDVLSYRDARRGKAAPAPCPSAGAAAESAPKSRSADHSSVQKREEERAGTGMGRQEHHAVSRVEFEFDTGMYSSGDVLAIYYEFARPRPQPRPFVDETEDEGFAPDMHSRTQNKPWWVWR